MEKRKEEEEEMDQKKKTKKKKSSFVGVSSTVTQNFRNFQL
jgi:hypothetical protein